MARPRLPAQKAEVSGAAIVNPGRFKGRKQPRARPLGEPYAGMTDEQRAAWEEFRVELSWLNSSHRALLQIACVLKARLVANPDLGVNALATYSAVLSKLGATPVDDTKVICPDGDDDGEPEDRFFGRPN